MIHTNTDNPLIARDRLTGRRTNRVHRETVKDESVTDAEVRADPGRYYPQWFNPSRDAPLPTNVSRERFDKLRLAIKDVHGGLDLAWHPIRQVWQIYIKSDAITSWWTKGWKRVCFIDPGGEDTALLVRMKAQLYAAEPEIFGRAKVGADRVLYEEELAQRKWDAHLDDGARYNARQIYQNGLISNIKPGNQYSKMYE